MADFYRELVKILRENGCQFVRTGKGSHELWHSPINDKPVVVPRSTTSRHTANDVLKKAGIPKAF